MNKLLNADELNKLYTEYYDIMDISKEQKLERIELAELLDDVFIYLFTYFYPDVEKGTYNLEEMYKQTSTRYEDAIESYGIDLKKYPEIKNYIGSISKDIVDSTISNNRNGKNSNSTNANINANSNANSGANNNANSGAGKKAKSNNVNNINNTTGNKVNNTSNNGANKPKQTLNADKVDNMPTKDKKSLEIQNRAISVAQNESNTIFNSKEYYDASYEGYKYKTWLSEQDDRVRETHIEVDGIRIPIDEPFDVGDSQMMFPRDYSLGASAKEIVNCRCSVFYS